MIIGLTQRTLEKLAFRYHLKNPERTSQENWDLACKLLEKLRKRYKINVFRG